MIKEFAEIEKLALGAISDPVIVACVEPHDSVLIRALKSAMDKRLVKPVLIGDEKAIADASTKAEVHTEGWELVRSTEPNQSVYTALNLVKDNKVNAICKGVFGIKDFLSLLFERNLGFRVGKNRVSGVMLCKVEQLDRILLISDPVVTPQPEMTDLLSILTNCVNFAQQLGYEMPKAALLAAVEVIYPQMPVTVTEAVISKMADKGQIKGCYVDGPLSMDVALIESAAKEKGAKGEVVGHADILIGPNLAVSYGIYKAFAMYTRSEYGMVTLGGKVPAVITSSYDDERVKYNSLLLAAIASSS